MKLTCSVCKFTITAATDAETAAYKTTRPMHCAQPMVVDGETEKEKEPGFFAKLTGKGKKKK